MSLEIETETETETETEKEREREKEREPASENGGMSKIDSEEISKGKGGKTRGTMAKKVIA